VTADDIASLMAHRLARLPAIGREFLETLPCLGNQSETA
jgi:hypothetical protein